MIGRGLLLIAGLAVSSLESNDVVATRHFVFRSDVRLNLHDELNRLTRTEVPLEAGERSVACFDALSEEHRLGWYEAVTFYRERLSHLHLRGDEMSAVRARILDAGAFAEGEIVEAVFRHLDRARPAYETCLWPRHNERNQAWIASVAPRVREHEAALTARLSGLFQHPWPSSPIPVDVVGWVSDSGANTIDDPPHVMISSLDESYRGDAALEMIFHEASHLLVDARYGKVSEEIYRANADRTLPRRDLWHTVLFFTVGEATRQQLASAGVGGYVPYLYAQGLIDRGWAPYREPLEVHWRSYIEGEIDLPTAAQRLVEAIHAR